MKQNDGIGSLPFHYIPPSFMLSKQRSNIPFHSTPLHSTTFHQSKHTLRDSKEDKEYTHPDKQTILVSCNQPWRVGLLAPSFAY